LTSKITELKKTETAGTELFECSRAIHDIQFDVLKRYLFPALPLLECNPGIVSQMWSLIDKYTYQVRYTIYEDWFTNLVSPSPKPKENLNPSMLMCLSEFLKQTKMFLKVLSNDKELDKMNSRIFARISHNCPLIVFNEIIKQLKIYNNIIPPVANSLSYVMNLGVEASIFLLLRHLSEFGKKTFKEEEGLVEPWLQNISHFVGLTIKRHHKVQSLLTQADLTPIFVYLANRLASESDYDIIHIVLFKEILSKMSGYETLYNYTDNQLASLSGGIALKTEAFRLAEQVRT
jgi:THO complex subunit 2